MRQIIMAGLVFSIFLLVMIGSGRHFLAEVQASTEPNSTLKLNWNPEKADIRKAISLNPGNAEYYFKLAKYHMRRRYRDKGSLKEFNEQAIMNIRKGLRINPTHGDYWYHLGDSYALKRHYEEDDVLKAHWLPLADQSFDIGIRYRPNNMYILRKIAEYWVWRSSLFCEKESLACKQGIRKFQQIYQVVLGAEPTRWKKAVEQIWQYYPDIDIISGIAPPGDTESEALILQWIKQKEGIKSS